MHEQSDDTRPLTAWQTKTLDMLSRGYALAACRRHYSAAEWKQMNDLVSRGLVRKTPATATAWNRHGAFAKAD